MVKKQRWGKKYVDNRDFGKTNRQLVKRGEYLLDLDFVERWNQETPFGNCPACGSIGIEELYIPGDKDITFYCSDVTCKTIMGRRSPARTKWYQTKPQEIRDKELRDFYSWNNDHFPGQKLPEVCPD